jgi:hypothetical protein
MFPGRPVAVGLFLVNLLNEAASGALDTQIDSLARTLASFSGPVLLRIGYEFDNPINAYDPATYRAAFTRIAQRTRALAPTAATVWQSEAGCAGTYMNQSIDAWYPGDAYVDWVGISYFQQSAQCNNYAPTSVLALARQHGKPVIIAESTPQGYDLTGLSFSSDGNQFQSVAPSAIWSAWFAPYFAFIHANQDVVRAVAYIDADWNGQAMWKNPANGYWGDSRVQQNSIIEQMWTSELSGAAWVAP